jgi:glycosyltransferase involved in cell wall biosynthesis
VLLLFGAVSFTSLFFLLFRVSTYPACDWGMRRLKKDLTVGNTQEEETKHGRDAHATHGQDAHATRLLVVNQVAGPLTRQLLEDLPARGIAPELLAGWVDAEGGEKLGFRWRSACPLRKSPAWRRLWTWLRFAIRAKFYLALRRRTPALISTNPPLLMSVASGLRRLLGLRYVLLVYDVYPDVLERMKVIRRGGLLTRWWRRSSRKAMLRAAGVITLGPHMAQTLRGHLRRGEDVPIEVIPNWADTDFIRPLAKADNPFAKAHGLEGKFVVMYSGSLGATHDTESIVSAAEMLKDLPDVQFVIIGEGTRRKEVEAMVARKALPNLTLLPLQPYSTLPQSLPAADCGIVCLDEGFEGVSVPSKTYLMMAAGAAILAVSPDQTELTDLVKEFSCGLCVGPRDPAALAGAIRKLHDDRALTVACREASRRAAVERFSRKGAADRYAEFLRRTLFPAASQP